MWGKFASAFTDKAKGLGERLGNFGLADGQRAQMSPEAFKQFRNDQLWNVGAALQGQDGGRDPYANVPSAQQQAQSLDLAQQAPQIGQGGMMGFGLNFGKSRGQRRGGLSDMGGY